MSIQKWPENIPDVPLYISKWFLWENRACLQSLIKPGDTIIECGSWVGESTRWLAELVYDRDNPSATGKVYAIDHWLGSIEHAAEKFDNIRPLLYDTFLYNCWQYREIITPVKTDSLSGLQLLYNNGIKPNLIYIDASHEYVDVVKDINTAYSLFPSSIICGDDCGTSPNEVGRAVKEFAQNHNFNVASQGNFWMIRKSV